MSIINESTDQLHLTRLAGIVQMRPQNHHIDAKKHMDTLESRRATASAEPARTTEPRAIQMTVRSADDDTLDANSVGRFFQAAQAEPWTKLNYHNSSVSNPLLRQGRNANSMQSQESYDVYHEKLFLQDTEHAPKLKSNMNAEQYFDALSAPRHDRRHRIRKRNKKGKRPQEEEDDLSTEEDEGANQDGIAQVDGTNDELYEDAPATAGAEAEK